MKDTLPVMSPENRAKYLAKAGEKSRQRREAYQEAAKDLRQDFADAPYWQRLASKHGVRLPVWFYPCEVKRMRRFLRRLGLREQDYREAHAEPLSRFAEQNPEWPLWAWCGLVLEDLESGAMVRPGEG